jgi:hypothetical protein
MSRNFILATGAFLWATLAIEYTVLVAIGHWVAPAGAAIVGVLTVFVMRVRRARRAVPERA